MNAIYVGIKKNHCAVVGVPKSLLCKT